MPSAPEEVKPSGRQMSVPAEGPGRVEVEAAAKEAPKEAVKETPKEALKEEAPKKLEEVKMGNLAKEPTEVKPWQMPAPSDVDDAWSPRCELWMVLQPASKAERSINWFTT